MIFLIQYDRRAGRRIRFERFDDRQREAATTMRLDLEIAARDAGLDHEIVPLEADREEDIRRTHRRYFETFEQVVADVRKIAGVAGG